MHPTTTGKTPHVAESAPLNALFSKINWRIIPLLLIAYMVAYLDRINIGYAQLQMKQTLPFSDAVYGLGAGIFFIGYFLFEVPSNLLLEKIGARKTLLRIMVLWGAAAVAMMFVSTPTQFYVVRFLLGAFEAGFFPGVILYFTYWYPSVRRGQVIAIFMSATTIVSVIAGPLCGSILKYFDGIAGLHGWQWLFLVQGLPAIILGFLVFVLLQDKPSQASWLSSEEKALHADRMNNDVKDVQGEPAGSFAQCLRDPKRTPIRQVAMFASGPGSGHLATELMKQAIDSARGRTIYSQRIATVEPVFANIRHTKRLDRFTLRGKEKVGTQWRLYCLVHNIEKLARGR